MVMCLVGLATLGYLPVVGSNLWSFRGVLAVAQFIEFSWSFNCSLRGFNNRGEMSYCHLPNTLQNEDIAS